MRITQRMMTNELRPPLETRRPSFIIAGGWLWRQVRPALSRRTDLGSTQKAVSPRRRSGGLFYASTRSRFPMPFAGLRQACRFVFVAERYPPSRWKMTHQRSFLSH